MAGKIVIVFIACVMFQECLLEVRYLASSPTGLVGNSPALLDLDSLHSMDFVRLPHPITGHF